MALHETTHHGVSTRHGSKTLAEGAVCFACALAALTAAAVAIQWLLGALT